MNSTTHKLLPEEVMAFLDGELSPNEPLPSALISKRAQIVPRSLPNFAACPTS